MLWYLLYPIRGTSRAPRLAPNHPIRRVAQQYAVTIARHVPITLLISVAIVTAFVYPIPFLYAGDLSSGASGVPHHVWTNAEALQDGITVEPDVIIRSIWIHGNYMKALDRDVLLGALELQNNLHNDIQTQEQELASSATNQPRLWHSPLLYWKNDANLVASDPDILGTVNDGKTMLSQFGVTLRHPVVFSGEVFEDRALVAADALVITLIYHRDAPVSRQWEHNAADIAARATDKWIVYPKNGLPSQSHLYEFQALPLSPQDNFMLILAYSITFLYVLQYLAKLPAIKSRPGLMLTFVAQIFISIMSSFTVCAIFQIDLSRIPRATYPIVIIAMSLENMLRLTKGVTLTKPEDSTSNRIGEAFGKNAHIAITSVVEHLILLWILSHVVTPSLSAFCIFLAIAVVFDFFYLCIFFLSVLSIEVRRTELGEAIERSTAKSVQLDDAQPTTLSSKWNLQSWIANGRIDLSTRYAGTIVMLGFVVIAQWHFFQTGILLQTLGRIFGVAPAGVQALRKSVSPLESVHQARSLPSWLQMQDHQTTQEVINVVKPWAHSYVARVYDPLVFVLKGSNRTPTASSAILSPAVSDFAHHRMVSFVSVILLVVVALYMFIHYLLLDKTTSANDDGEGPGSVLSEKTLENGHSLDIALMSASSDGVVVSVGLDRLIRVWNVPYVGMNYLLSDHDDSQAVPFPVLAMAVDRDSSWLAIVTTNRVMVWSLNNKEWEVPIPVELHGQRPEAVFFVPNLQIPWKYSLIVVRTNGTMAQVSADTMPANFRICMSPFVSAAPVYCPSSAASSSAGKTSLVTVSRVGCIHHVSSVGDSWISQEVKQEADKKGTAQAVVALSFASAYLIVGTRSVDLVDLDTSKVIHAFVLTAPIQARSLRYLYALRRQSQPESPALSYFSLAYISSETGDCVIETYTPEQEDGFISFFSDELLAGTPCRAPGAGSSWNEAQLITRQVPNPGRWATLPSGSIIGVRRKGHNKCIGKKSANSSTGCEGYGFQTAGGLRRRGKTPGAASAAATATAVTATATKVEDGWEAWSVCGVAENDRHNTSQTYVTQALEIDSGGLLVEEPGPICAVGAATVAVALGTDIKLITMGHEWFGSADEMLEAAAGQFVQASNADNRRRKYRSFQAGQTGF